MQQDPDMHLDIIAYNKRQNPNQQAVCNLLASEIERHLQDADGKIWHAHPVWFLNGNPIVGYSKQKPGTRLMFWSGADFDEPGLDVVGKKFKDASRFFNEPADINKRTWRAGFASPNKSSGITPTSPSGRVVSSGSSRLPLIPSRPIACCMAKSG